MNTLSDILNLVLPKVVRDFLHRQQASLEQQTNRVLELLQELSLRDNELAHTKESLKAAEAEIRRLKKLPKRPNIQASKLDESSADKSDKKSSGKKGGKKWSKGSKKGSLTIDEQKIVPLCDVPAGWQLVGYRSYVIQDMVIRSHNTEYLREVWRSPNGLDELVADVPEGLSGKQFGHTINAFVLYLYYECCVSQALILGSLGDYGIRISAGQINRLLNDNNVSFHEEKEGLLGKAIELGEELRTDDTGARHEAKNAYCNCINSDLFTYFSTTFSKSRINFLEILRRDIQDYVLNSAALDYMESEKLPSKYISVFQQVLGEKDLFIFEDKQALDSYLLATGFTAKYAVRTITEALLIGTLVEHGFSPQTHIHSDGAGQFNVFLHSLCWKHAERPLLKLRIYNEKQQKELDDKKTKFWQLYQDLKAFKEKPEESKIEQLGQQFDDLCEEVADFTALNQVLEELKKKKDRLLRVLEKPTISLHNNDSERDIREYVKRRKISAGTRSEKGKKARDTFLSLKKTCRKLGISFWEYLNDRLRDSQGIPMLYELMQERKWGMD